MAANAVGNAAAQPSCFANLTTKYNELVHKVAGKTFEVVKKVELQDDDGIFSRITKVMTAFLATATIVPMVGLFLAKAVVNVYETIMGKMAPIVVPPDQQQPVVAAAQVQAPAPGQQPVAAAAQVQAEGQHVVAAVVVPPVVNPAQVQAQGQPVVAAVVVPPEPQVLQPPALHVLQQ